VGTECHKLLHSNTAFLWKYPPPPKKKRKEKKRKKSLKLEMLRLKGKLGVPLVLATATGFISAS
jgi:hypothetical protein